MKPESSTSSVCHYHLHRRRGDLQILSLNQNLQYLTVEECDLPKVAIALYKEFGSKFTDAVAQAILDQTRPNAFAGVEEMTGG